METVPTSVPQPPQQLLGEKRIQLQSLWGNCPQYAPHGGVSPCLTHLLLTAGLELGYEALYTIEP